MFKIPARKSGFAALAVTAALVMSACGSLAPAPAGSPEPSAAATQTIKDTFLGDVEAPSNSQRVLALWRTGNELADLGVVPVGALEDELTQQELSPAQREANKDVPTVGTYEGVDLEKVIALKPDVITGMDNARLGIDYKALQEIAPVLILKIAEPTDVWKNYPKVVEVVGKSTDFDARSAKLGEALDSVKASHGANIADAKTTLIGADESSLWVDTSKSLAYEPLTKAGFSYNDAYTKDPARYATELTKENLSSLADQDIIFYDQEADGSISAPVQALLDEPAFKRLPAVEAGNLFPFRGATVYTFDTAERQVEDLAKAAENYKKAGA